MVCTGSLNHCETISDRNIERVKALGGGIAVQNRMAFQVSTSLVVRPAAGRTNSADQANA